MVVMCDASETLEYGRRTPELSNAPLHIKLDIDSIDIYTLNLDLDSNLDSDLDSDLPLAMSLTMA
tara:strand:- start:154 stop:348 length:195 start_codon:yes stop_codon:yes gene_type:complete